MSRTPDTSKPRVLVVDDEPANRKLLADLVAREGYEALTAAGGAEALARLAREPVDLVLLDIMMPGVDGMAVLAELQKQQRLPALPVVVVTAHEDRKVRIDALTAGAIDFLAKPIDRVEVGCKVRTLVELKRLRERAVDAASAEARASQLSRVEVAIAGLPLVAYEMQMGGPKSLSGRWIIGDMTGLNGVTAEEFFDAQDWSLRVHPDDRGLVEQHLRLAIDGTKADFSSRFRLKVRGEYKWRFSAARFEAASATLRGILLDIDHQVATEEKLLQAGKMDAMGQLAGGIAHDFNNILAVILSYSSFIRDALPEGDQRRADIVEVLKAGDHAAGLTRQLLAFSRQQPTEKKPVDVNRSLAELHKLLVRTLGEHVALNVSLSAQPVVVRIDPVQLDQIVLNLAVNARDAMPGGGKLRIALEHAPQTSTEPGDHGWVHLKVTDTGTGMDQRTQQHIFEPFFTTKEKGNGTGLGLATCFGIVADAGGQIRVKSAPGQGTTFTVELPLCGEEADSDVGESTRLARAGHGEIVLLAEDDAALRRVAARVLGSAGYTVHAVADGKEAIEKLDELGSRLDLLLSDVVMPGCSGYDVAEHASRVAPQAAVLLTSGFVDKAAGRHHRKDLPILWKPVAPRELVRAVAEALGARPTSGTPAVAEGAAGGLVLVVEDDEAAGKAMVRVLAGAGYASTVAATVADARRALETGPEPQLVLCDLSLPDGSGAELLEWLEQTRPALCPRVFVLTGGVTDEAGRRVTSSGRFRVLPKAVQPRHLLEVLAGAGKSALPVPAPTAAKSAPAMPSRPPASRPITSPVRRERVLIVDDDESLAGAGKRILSDDFEVVVVGTLGAARTALGDVELDALVLDLGLPDGSGLELLRELRGKNSELPIVMMTGALSTEAAAQALRSRVSEYLPKPFAPEELLRAVRTAVDAGRMSRVRTKLLAARFGGDEFVNDLPGTEKSFALALPKIRMVFQPIVRAADTSVFGYEALLRCDEPSLATPLRLFAAAELLGRVEDVGRVVRAQVAATMLAQPTRLEAIFLNIHPAEVRADLLSEVTDPLLAVADRVILEITERASLAGGSKLDAELARIRGLGYRLAVDDLGEGYAGLSSLVHLRPDIAKIDMSLVRDVHRAPLKRDIIAALVDMARRSGIVVVAEGIETVDERDTLVDLGCDLLQGYLFAKPGPAFPVPRTCFERKEERR